MNKIIILLLALIIFGAAILFVARNDGKQLEEASVSGSEDISTQTAGNGKQTMSLSDVETVPVNVQNSVLSWSAKRIIGTSNHNGTVGVVEGKFIVYNGEVMGGDFIVDMTSLSVSDSSGERLEKHLKSDDFFDVEEYPEAKLSIVNVEKSGDRYNVVADLTIKEITNEVAFPATLSSNDGAISADASFSIDRTRWEITYGSGSFFDDLGDQAIDDMINFDVHVET